MNADTKTTIEITLKLTAKEAIWLKELVQNPQCDPSDESDEDIAMRKALFDALPSFPDLFQANTKDDAPQ